MCADAQPSEATIDPATLARIDELCAAADREWTSAHTPTGRGGTVLTEFRDLLLGYVRGGHSLPGEWHHIVDNGFQTICLRQRLEAYGTTEWRQAYPWLVEIKQKNGTLP